jgi:hypothetical protein
MDTKIEVTSPESGIVYTAGGRIGGTKAFTMYECFPSNEERKCCILKIAADSKHNSSLDKEAYILKAMLDEAARLEEAFLEANPGTEMRMNYHFSFPNIIETFISSEQKSRRILVLSLDNIGNSLSDLVPLSHLEIKEHVRIDQRTSAWIMGKLLKTFVLTHGIGITNEMVCRDNILVNRNEHFVALFNWSNAKMQKQVEKQKGAHEIAQLAQAIILALGGNLETGAFYGDGQFDPKYVKLLREFALGKRGDAHSAHGDFYILIDELWPREFHPFTTYPLG